MTTSAAEAVATFVQGQVFRLPTLAVLSTTQDPELTEAKAAAAMSASPPGLRLIPVRVASGQVMLVTQTCDLQARHTIRGRSMAHVAPVVTLDADDLRNARTDSQPRYVPTPWLSNTSFADLDQMSPVDRSILARCESVATPSESERSALAYRLGRYLSRPALPDDVVQALKPLAKLAEAAHRDVQKVLDAVQQIRVSSSPSYDQRPPWHLHVLLVVGVEWLPDTEPSHFRATGQQYADVAGPLVDAVESGEPSRTGEVVTLWSRFTEVVVRKLNDGLETRSHGSVEHINAEVVTSLTVDQIEESDVLDFGHLSLDDADE